MKKFLLLAFTLILAQTLFAADFNGLPDNVRASLPAIGKYPKASSILLSCKESYKLNSDGSKVYEWHSFRYLPDEASRDNFGDPRVAYVEGRQKLEILGTRTFTRDGRIIECTPQNAFNPATPDVLDKAPDYSVFKQMVVTLLGLENGCISEVHYRLTTAKPLVPWMEGRVYFRDVNPIIAHELSVEVPQSTVLTYHVDRGASEPALNNGTYSWKVGEQPGYLAEDLGGHRVLLPNVSFTTAKDWQTVQGELKNRVDANSVCLIDFPKSLNAMLNGTQRAEQKMDSIQAWLRGRFNVLQFEHPDFALTLRPSIDVLNSGYGNRLEMTVLAVKLAVNAGVDAKVVPCILPEPVVPSLVEWAGAVLNVTPEYDLNYYCDPVQSRDEFSGHDLNGCWLLPLDEKAAAPAEYKSATHNPQINLALSLGDLGADTLRGTGSFDASGEWGIAEKIRARGAADILGELITCKGLTITQALVLELSSRATESRIVVNFSFTAAALDTAESRRLLSLAFFDFSRIVKGTPLILSTREFAQEIHLPGKVTLKVEGTLPEGWTCERKPTSGTQQWDWSEGTTKCDVKENRLVFQRSLKLAREWLAPDGWKGFRGWFIDSGARPANAIVFKTK